MVFYKMIVLFSLVIVRHAESTQNDKFVISLQNLTKEVGDAIKFLQADKLS